jgi:hypothetical protein
VIDAEEMYLQLQNWVEENYDLTLDDKADDLLAEFTQACAEQADQVAKFEAKPDDDPYGRYQMYTRDANAHVHKCVAQLETEMRGGTLPRRLLRERIAEMINHIGATHPEVWDTEPRGAIADRVDEICADLLWLTLEEEDMR